MAGYFYQGKTVKIPQHGEDTIKTYFIKLSGRFLAPQQSRGNGIRLP